MIAPLIGLFKRIALKKLFVFWLDQWAIIFPGTVPGLLGILLRTMYFKCTAATVKGLFYARPFVKIEHSYGLSVGRNVHINYGCYLEARGGITLGNHVLIGPNCSIVSFNHAKNTRAEDRLEGSAEFAPVTLEDGVWLGANVVVLPCVTLGAGTTVAAGAVVTKSFPAGVTIGGIPAKEL